MSQTLIVAIMALLFVGKNDANRQLEETARRSHFAEFRFFDPAGERRAIQAVGDINYEYDVQIQINCRSSSCAVDLPKLFEILKGISRSNSPCKTRPYGRLRLLESENSQAIKTVYFDYFGRCVTIEGTTYQIDDNFIAYIRDRGVSGLGL